MNGYVLESATGTLSHNAHGYRSMRCTLIFDNLCIRTTCCSCNTNSRKLRVLGKVANAIDLPNGPHAKSMGVRGPPGEVRDGWEGIRTAAKHKSANSQGGIRDKDTYVLTDGCN